MNDNKEDSVEQKTTRKTPPARGMKLTDMVGRVKLPLDAVLVLISLTGGPDTRERLIKRLRKYGTDTAAGISRLVEERLVEARDGLLHMRPVEEWDNDGHFMNALALRWPA